MKKILLIIAGIGFGIQVHAQDTVIKSVHLDSLIVKEINRYRVGLGISEIKVFEYGEMRKISYVLTDSNSNREFIEHTKGNKIFVGYNSECIFRYKTTKTDSFKLTEDELQTLAKRTVQAWIDSPNHNWIISCPLAQSCTVTTVIKKRGKNFSLTASYHAKNKKLIN
jgi:hypothetical protein